MNTNVTNHTITSFKTDAEATAAAKHLKSRHASFAFRATGKLLEVFGQFNAAELKTFKSTAEQFIKVTTPKEAVTA